MTTPQDATEALAWALHPEGRGPVVDCCTGSTSRNVHGEVEGERLHREYHARDARNLAAALAADGWSVVRSEDVERLRRVDVAAREEALRAALTAIDELPHRHPMRAGFCLPSDHEADRSHSADLIDRAAVRAVLSAALAKQSAAQARADERRRLAELVAALPGIVLSSSSGTDGHLSWGIYRAAVLALLSDTEPAP